MSTQVKMTFVKRPESTFKGNEIWNVSPFSNHIPAGRLAAHSLHTTAFAQYKSSQKLGALAGVFYDMSSVHPPLALFRCQESVCLLMERSEAPCQIRLLFFFISLPIASIPERLASFPS